MQKKEVAVVRNVIEVFTEEGGLWDLDTVMWALRQKGLAVRRHRCKFSPAATSTILLKV